MKGLLTGAQQLGRALMLPIAVLPVAALVDQFYSEIQKMGGKRWDTSSLLARLDR